MFGAFLKIWKIIETDFMLKRLHFGSRYVYNQNENNFCIISGPRGLLKLDIMVPKANVLTYICSFLKLWKITEN